MTSISSLPPSLQLAQRLLPALLALRAAPTPAQAAAQHAPVQVPEQAANLCNMSDDGKGANALECCADAAVRSLTPALLQPKLAPEFSMHCVKAPKMLSRTAHIGRSIAVLESRPSCSHDARCVLIGPPLSCHEPHAKVVVVWHLGQRQSVSHLLRESSQLSIQDRPLSHDGLGALHLSSRFLSAVCTALVRA